MDEQAYWKIQMTNESTKSKPRWLEPFVEKAQELISLVDKEGHHKTEFINHNQDVVIDGVKNACQ